MQLGNHRHRCRGAGVAATAALLTCGLATSAPALAQTVVSVGQPCYVNANPMKGAPIQVSGSGFTPGDQLELAATDVFGTATVGSSGAFTTTVRGPILSTPFPAQRRFTLKTRDETNGVAAATTTFRVANLAFRTKPGLALPGAIVRYSFSGFRAGHAIYGHFVHGRKVITDRFGRAQGPCGLLTTRTKLFPGGDPRFTRYNVQFDDSRRYHTQSTPRIDTSISIRRY